jgi:hypothetical protein
MSFTKWRLVDVKYNFFFLQIKNFHQLLCYFLQGQSTTIRTLIMHSMAEWYMRGDHHDQTRLSRILDVAQDLKVRSILYMLKNLQWQCTYMYMYWKESFFNFVKSLNLPWNIVTESTCSQCNSRLSKDFRVGGYIWIPTHLALTRLFKSASVYCSITVTHSFTNSREMAFSALSIDSRKVKNFHFSTSFTHKVRNKSSKISVDLSL